MSHPLEETTRVWWEIDKKDTEQLSWNGFLPRTTQKWINSDISSLGPPTGKPKGKRGGGGNQTEGVVWRNGCVGEKDTECLSCPVSPNTFPVSRKSCPSPFFQWFAPLTPPLGKPRGKEGEKKSNRRSGLTEWVCRRERSGPHLITMSWVEYNGGHSTQLNEYHGCIVLIELSTTGHKYSLNFNKT